MLSVFVLYGYRSGSADPFCEQRIWIQLWISLWIWPKFDKYQIQKFHKKSQPKSQENQIFSKENYTFVYRK